MIEIKPITKIDEPLAEQIYELKHQLSEDHTYSMTKYQRAMNSPQTIVLGAWNDEELVGLAVLNAVFTLGSAICDLDDVVVDESWRGQGIGRLLLDAAADQCRSGGLHTIRLTSAAKRLAANKLYQNYGFVLRGTNSYRYTISRNRG